MAQNFVSFDLNNIPKVDDAPILQQAQQLKTESEFGKRIIKSTQIQRKLRKRHQNYEEEHKQHRNFVPSSKFKANTNVNESMPYYNASNDPNLRGYMARRPVQAHLSGVREALKEDEHLQQSKQYKQHVMRGWTKKFGLSKDVDAKDHLDYITEGRKSAELIDNDTDRDKHVLESYSGVIHNNPEIQEFLAKKTAKISPGEARRRQMKSAEEMSKRNNEIEEQLQRRLKQIKSQRTVSTKQFAHTCDLGFGYYYDPEEEEQEEEQPVPEKTSISQIFGF
ncbi:hypothetical protein PCE1_002420 [Barthelona sp. PCE]